ncbi:Cytochrome oxidase assembly protein ShyY1 [Sinosporangium album]|uniref:SURF1-like protein n=1 Tax=Sinosporangium album TaxID=504805 RepID=A0A1G8FGN7_9ACTN|nr:SURF1 family protein [Sinosporangium album]SDH81311.1 Cytochrome oxidase assembly protein ShyY1 [Sinosporangium album]
MYRFLLTPRWLVLHVVVLLVIPAFVLLGQWQFGRFEEESSATDLASTNLAAKPVPVTTLLPAGAQARPEDKHRPVTVAGSFDAGNQVLVRRRPQHGQTGFYVLTPLVLGEGQAVLVNRGWVKAGASADAVPDVPPPTSGQVHVTGRLRLSETEESSGVRNRAGLPPGQVLLIDVPAIGARLPYKLLGGYVELTSQTPPAATAPDPVPPPDVGGGGGLNLAYGVQWWLFIGVAIGGWILLIRREAADRQQSATAADLNSDSGDSAVRDSAVRDSAGTSDSKHSEDPEDSEDSEDSAGSPALSDSPSPH